MHTPREEIRRLLSSRLVLLALAWLSWKPGTQALELESDVAAWIEPGQAVAIGLVSGRREISLDAQETVIASGANGINALVVTSRRLLGFSNHTLTWSETDRGLHETILERLVLPTYRLLRTDKRLYGFRGANGLWLKKRSAYAKRLSGYTATITERWPSPASGL